MLVNDMADVNVDAATMASDTAARSSATAAAAATEMLESLSGGCICCTLRPDFVRQLAEMAATVPRLDAIIVESTGISEPQQVAEVFDIGQDDDASDDTGDASDDTGDAASAEDAAAAAKAAELARLAEMLRSRCRLDCMVTVVDALNFAADLRTTSDSLVDRGMALSAGDSRSVSELLIEQVEFANIIYVNKLDLVPADEAARLVALLRTLAPRASVRTCVRSAVPPEDVLDTRLFDMAAARTSPGWLASLAGEHVPESIEFGISNFVFRARRPFHPGRLYALLFSELSEQQAGSSAGGGGSAAPHAPSGAAAMAAARMQVVKASGRSSKGGGGSSSSAAAEVPAVTLPAHPCAAHLPPAPPADVAALARVVRSKGIAWLGADWGHRQRLDWGQAGKVWQFSPGAPWLAATPLREWPDDAVRGLAASGLWQSGSGDKDDAHYVGDRETELVLIGVGMDAAAVRAALEHALLSDDEMVRVYKPALAEDAVEAAAEAPAIARALALAAEAETAAAAGGADERDSSAAELRCSKPADAVSTSTRPAMLARAQRREMERALAVMMEPAWAGGWDFEDEDEDGTDEDTDGEDVQCGGGAAASAASALYARAYPPAAPALALAPSLAAAAAAAPADGALAAMMDDGGDAAAHDVARACEVGGGGGGDAAAPDPPRPPPPAAVGSKRSRAAESSSTNI